MARITRINWLLRLSVVITIQLSLAVLAFLAVPDVPGVPDILGSLGVNAQNAPRARDLDEETFNIAVQLQLDSNHSEAARLYETLLAAGSDDLSVYYNLGVAYAYVGDLQSALSASLQAAQLAPRAADIRSNVRVITQALGVNPPLILPLTQRELLSAALIFWTLLGLLIALKMTQGRARPLLVVPSGLGLLVCLAGFVWQVSQYGVML
jgi:tetratricopeptide (TPR) repeat protein